MATKSSRRSPQLAANGTGMPPQFDSDGTQRKTPMTQALNLVAFVLAQVRVAHVHLHLPVKLRRLPHLRLFSWSGVALQY